MIYEVEITFNIRAADDAEAVRRSREIASAIAADDVSVSAVWNEEWFDVR